MGSKSKLSARLDSSASSGERINYYSFLLTCLILFLTMGVSSTGTFRNYLTKTVTLSDGPTYTDINITVKYDSDPNYDSDGFEWLYSTTKKFMDLLLEDAFPKDIITIHGDNEIDVNLDGHVSDLLSQYAVVVAVSVILVIFAITMFLTGLCFTCYCCCSKSRPNNEKKKCKKICLIGFLIICVALITFGSVCVFLTNVRLQDGVKGLPDDLDKSINDTKTFLGATIDQINILLGDNFNQLTDWLSLAIDEFSTTANNGVDEIAEKMNIDEIFTTADKFVAIGENVNEIMKSVTEVQTLATSLKSTKASITDTLDSCLTTSPECQQLEAAIEKLIIPDIINTDSLYNILKKVLNIPDEIKEAKTQYNSIKTKITSIVESSKTSANDEIKKAGVTIKENVDKISTEVKKLLNQLPNSTHTGDDDFFLDKAQKYIDEYDPYRHYVGLAICIVLFSIIGLLAFGMICGFGRNSFLNKSGSLFLLCGTTLIFYLTIVIAALTLIYFLVGMVAQQGVCKPLREPSQSEFFKLVDQIDLNKYGLNLTISGILSSIRQDGSAYNVFDLKSKFDINQVDDYLENFKTALDEVEKLADKIDLKNFEMLTKEQIDTLRNIKGPDFSSVTTFLDQLKTDFTTDVIKPIISQLETTITKVAELGLNDLASKLKTAESDLNGKTEEIGKLSESIPNMKKVISNLTEEIKLGEDSFDEGKNNLIDLITNAQDTLNKEGPAKIKKIVSDLGDKVLNVCSDYLDRVKNETENDVGKCGPLGDIIEASLTTVCDKIASQMNSIWFILLWTMVIFLPTVIISTKLANIYKSEASLVGSSINGQNEGNAESRFISNGNADLISRDVRDIPLDKWEQYPPPQQSNASRTPEEYTRPPPYFYDREPTVLELLAKENKERVDRMIDNRRWDQYRETMSGGTRF